MTSITADCLCGPSRSPLRSSQPSRLIPQLTLLPGGGGIERLPLLVGRARALEIILGSDDFDAATAAAYGWINRALPDAELDDIVDIPARRIASFDKSR
jgi:enoyl-CoA hydratase/carnithine racemase